LDGLEGLDGVEDALVSKLEAAIKSLDKGQEKAARNQLGAFVNQLEAQSGKGIPAEVADQLIAEALAIIGNI
jgi:hypothetical protein